MTVLPPGTRLAVGRARVVRELRASAPLLAAVRAPVPARAPWLTAVVNSLAAGPTGGLPVAVVVEDPPHEVPVASALLHVRRGPRTTVRLLGSAAPVLPGGRPAGRLPVRDPAGAERLAEAIVALLAARRGRWRLDLDGLPLGDPTAAALATRLPTAVLGNERSTRLVDDFDPALRSRDARDVELALPTLLAGEARPRARAFLRAVTRLHAAIGEVEVAQAQDGAVLLTLVDGADRWPSRRVPAEAARTEMGAPLVRLTADGWGARDL